MCLWLCSTSCRASTSLTEPGFLMSCQRRTSTQCMSRNSHARMPPRFTCKEAISMHGQQPCSHICWIEQQSRGFRCSRSCCCGP